MPGLGRGDRPLTGSDPQRPSRTEIIATMPTTTDVLAYVRGALPAPPGRVLEIGAGDGELASALTDAGYEVTAIDPAAEPDGLVQPIPLIEVEGSFDAAVAVVSLHHVEPLIESLAHLAELLPAGAPLVIDELDCQRFDERAARWWRGQRQALGHEDGHDGHAPSTPAEMVADLRSHVHSIETILAALAPAFEVGRPVPGPYMHRWHLPASLRDTEVELIAAGHLPPVGCRLIAVSRSKRRTIQG
jgi:SAM-dependent methyltransferase